MLKIAGSIKSYVGLAALSVISGYMISSELVTGGYVEAEFSVILILSSMVIFSLMSFLFLILIRVKKQIIAAQSSAGVDNDQSIKASKEYDASISQKTIGKGNSQKIDLS